MSGDTALEARSVSFAYTRPVVESVSLSVPYGSVTALIGPNGCGKSTVLKLLDGILQPKQGEIRLRGRLVSTLSRAEIARHIAMVPQNSGIPAYTTVFEFAMQGRSPHLSLLGFESERDEKIANEALELTGLSGHRSARVAEISGGERQRLLLARALAQRAPILLLDEFTANLDIKYQVDLMRLVAGISRTQKMATLVVSHEINLVAAFADRVALMSAGRILSQGSVAEAITPENLHALFELSFTVRMRGGSPEIFPQLTEGETR